MEKRSRGRVPELVTRLAFQGLSENEIGRARISMMARNANVPFKGRIQKRKTYHLQIITFGLQRAAGPYNRVSRVDSAMSGLRPLMLQERRQSGYGNTSYSCHNPTFAVSIKHLVSANIKDSGKAIASKVFRDYSLWP